MVTVLWENREKWKAVKFTLLGRDVGAYLGRIMTKIHVVHSQELSELSTSSSRITLS